MTGWTPISKLDEVTPDYAQQYQTWYILRHRPDPTNSDPTLRMGTIYPVPGYLLGSKRTGNWEYCPIADFWAAEVAPPAQPQDNLYLDEAIVALQEAQTNVADALSLARRAKG